MGIAPPMINRPLRKLAVLVLFVVALTVVIVWWAGTYLDNTGEAFTFGFWAQVYGISTALIGGLLAAIFASQGGTLRRFAMGLLCVTLTASSLALFYTYGFAAMEDILSGKWSWEATMSLVALLVLLSGALFAGRAAMASHGGP